MKKEKRAKRKKLGLALGSGAGRGLAHIGVLKCLDRHGIKVDYIAGSSIGAWFGAIYSSGQSGEEMEKLLVENKKAAMKCFFEPSLRSGLIKGKKLHKLVEEWVKFKTFRGLKIPFAAASVDLLSGEEATLNKGNLPESIMASMAVPGVFPPVKIGDKLLADGGLVNPVPDDLVKKMGADVVVSVNLDYRLSSDFSEKDYKSIKKTGFRGLSILRHYLAEYSINDSDITLNPEFEDSGIMGFKYYFKKGQPEKTIEMGEKLMEKKIRRLKELLQ